MSKKFITVKEVNMNNNCPECFGQDGLQLSFKQEFVETPLYKKVTKNVSHEIHCSKCNTAIYPVMWTDDMERVFNYHQRGFTPKKTSTKLKGLAWGIIIGAIVIIAAIVAFAYYKLNLS